MAKAARHSFSDGGLARPGLFFMHYVYLIRSIKHPQRKYIGQTDDIVRRLSVHNSGGSIFTRDFRPWELVLFLGFENKSKAIGFEKHLKSGAGRAFAKKRFW